MIIIFKFYLLQVLQLGYQYSNRAWKNHQLSIYYHNNAFEACIRAIKYKMLATCIVIILIQFFSQSVF